MIDAMLNPKGCLKAMSGLVAGGLKVRVSGGGCDHGASHQVPGMEGRVLQSRAAGIPRLGSHHAAADARAAQAMVGR